MVRTRKTKEKKVNFGFTPSPYQEKIFDFVQHGVGNGVISALAGSGKTASLVACVKLIPSECKCLFLAFNKSIADELAEKLKNKTNCHVKTMHSLGYLMIRRNLGSDIVVDEYKYKTYIKRNISELTSINVRMTTQQAYEYVQNIIGLVDFARFNLAQSEKEIEVIAERYNFNINYDEPFVVRNVLEWGKKHTETIDYTDMVWFPTELSLNPIGLQYDWVFCDECQDFSLAYIQLLLKCFKRGTRFIAVGDRNQAINHFAGSSSEAYDYLINYPNTTVFELPITYRCPVSVVELAKQFVPNIEAREDAPLGLIKEDCKIREIKDGDMVLARTKAPILNLYAKLLGRGIRAYVKGTDIGMNLINLLESVDCENLGKNLDEDGVFVRLYDAMFTMRNNLMNNLGLMKSDASLSAQVIERYDSINSLMALADKKTDTKEKLIRRIEKVFSNEKKEGICLSTVHKAKGLEANNVFILCKDSMPSKLARTEVEKQQELNLIYVAYTRAKNMLGFISDKEVKGLSKPLEIINDMNEIEGLVCHVLGKTPMPDDEIEIGTVEEKNEESSDDDTSQLMVSNQDDEENTELRVKTSDNKDKPNNEMNGLLESYLKKGGDIKKLKEFLSK